MSRRLLTTADVHNNPHFNDLYSKAMQLSSVYNDWEERQLGDGHLRKPGVHASEISGCERRIAYSIMGTERVSKEEVFWQRKFKIGHAVHAMLQKDFHKMARDLELQPRPGWHITFYDELPISPKYQPLAKRWDIQSHFDGLFVIRETYDGPAILRILLEIKTKSPDQYKAMKEPELDHKEQTHLYMACYDVPLCWTMYYNKGNENHTATDEKFLITFDHNMWNGIVDRIDRVYNTIGTGVLPERGESIKCRFCPFSHTCDPPSLNRSAVSNIRQYTPIRSPRKK